MTHVTNTATIDVEKLRSILGEDQMKAVEAAINKASINEINLEGNAFLVPNTPAHWKQSVIDRGDPGCADDKSVCEANGVTFDASTYMAELWITGGASENWADHGYTLPDGRTLHLRGYFPVSLLMGRKEGETLAVNIPAETKMGDEYVKVMIHAKLTLRQLDYRYRRFGDFQTVLRTIYDNALESDNCYLRD